MKEQTETEWGKDYVDGEKKAGGAAAKAGVASKEGEGKGCAGSGAGYGDGTGGDGNDEDGKRKSQSGTGKINGRKSQIQLLPIITRKRS